MLDWYVSGGLLIGSLVGLMVLGIPVAIAFIIVNLIGAWILFGGAVGLLQIVDNTLVEVAHYPLTTAPLFILMGSLFFHTGLAVNVFNTIDQLMGKVPGRLSYLTVAGGTIYSTLTGSSLANTAMLGSLMVPEMRRRGYSQRLSIGPILGTGGLAIIIPPSTAAVLLGTIANIDVGRVLVAGLLPGLILAGLYGAAIYLQVRADPSAAPAYDVDKQPIRVRLMLAFVNLGPIALILCSVVGLIVFGITTPTESASIGVLGVVLLAISRRRLSRDSLIKSISSTVSVTGMIFLILMNSSAFSQLLAFSGASRGFFAAVSGVDLAPAAVVLCILFAVLVMGMFMEPVSIMLITVPVFYPLVQQLGFDLIWFSVIILIAIEMSLTTPPFGILLFVMLGVAGENTSLYRIATYALPYLACAGVLIMLLILFPQIALFLPNLVGS